MKWIRFKRRGVVAERVGFEPTVAKGYTRSPGAPDSPLQHLSTLSVLYLIFCQEFFRLFPGSIAAIFCLPPGKLNRRLSISKPVKI
jgi:hypothetical protein